MEDQLPFGDDALQMWVRNANASPGPSISIMLNMAGYTVVGTLCSGRIYYDGIAADFRRKRDADKQEEGYILEAIIKRLGDMYDRDQEDRDPGEEDEPCKIVYLHVADATIFIPGGMKTKVAFWRGRIDQVSGFSLVPSGTIQFNLASQ